MNGYERYVAALKDESIDFPPRTPILMQYAAEFIGSDYAAFAADYHILVKANLRCAQAFGMDQVSAISDPYRETQGFGASIEFHKDGPPTSSHPLESSKNFSALKQPYPYRSQRMLDRIRAIESYYADVQKTYSILGWIEGPAAEAADLRNVMPFLIDLVEDPVFASELMRRCVETGIDFAQAQLRAGADTIGIGDAIASQVSARTYEQLILPQQAVLVDAIKAMGGWVKLHICGDITHLLPGIATLDIDILDIDYMVDMKAARKKIGSKIAISGNLDPVRCVKQSTVAQIRQQLKRIYQEVGDPYIVNAGCEIPAGTPVENLQALCQPLLLQS